MTSSSTYSYSPQIEEFVSEAFERVGLDPATLTGRHARSARTSCNLMFAHWSNKGVMPFIVEQASDISFVVSQANYTIPSGTLAILDPIFIRSSVATPIHLISRGDYERIPNKAQDGMTSNMFYDRPSQTVWCWHRGELDTDLLGYWRLRRVQDVNTAAETPDVPYHGFEALASGLAAMLSLKFNPSKYALLKAEAREAFDAFADMERERAPASFGIQGL